ncbi:TonB family protein [Duganella sp. S19_KUP01_CR8]|uniref:TonB family protein n=1 Tax=Duganella sp. S19_KUP01_CR8 TaxID=3025502 RepID=UPI002FCD894C
MTKLYSHYESLNVTRDAPPEVIRAAYRSLSQKHHPDKNIGNHHAEQMMARLNAAYSVLSDADQRELYDLQILSEQRAREKHFGFHSNVDLPDSTVVYTPFDMDESDRASRPAQETSRRKPGKRLDACLDFIRHHTQGRRVRITTLLVGFLFLAIAIILWFIWKDNQSMMRLEQAAIYASVPEQSVPATGDDTKVIQASAPSSQGAKAAETSKPAAAPKAPPAASPATTKASEYERLTAMLKSMGLGLHKLDVPVQASNTRQPPAPAKAAEPVKAVEAPKASSAAPAPTPALAAKPAPAPEAVREAERPVAPEPARSEAKPVADASRAAPRTAVIVDAKACVPPKYPPNSYLSGESGSVLLALLVGNDGKVLESKVQKSSGFPDLDKAARRALSQCKFKPASSDGQGEPVWATLTYVWSLD